ncbi:PREDICTED: rotatin-like [Priapulus caudatus]|uniref:Rotatin-like n=1 Tax=Priapulus caudatus TaxID=37621 RepID=A0ABM1E661_PRICU|nr:PREDICTED: rotatin-like [Priapulus caudatus]
MSRHLSDDDNGSEADNDYRNKIITSLVQKTGHELVEIRERALQNILAKLEHDILSMADLVQERKLCINLLEWFNKTPCPMKSDVLGLLYRFSKHPSSKVLLIDIGSVDFLLQLRPDLTIEDQKRVDEILDQLFCLPDPEVPPKPSRSCTYQRQADVNTEGEVCQHDTPLQYTTVAPNEWREQLRTGYWMPEEGEADSDPNISRLTEDYFGNEVQFLPSHNGNENEQGSQGATGNFKIVRFPWVSLTATDEHVLSSTERSLHSLNADHVVTSCEFLKDVVMQDFPAETLLQRPAIVQSLALLLDASREEKVVTSAVSCLSAFTVYLLRRLAFWRDPAFFTTKTDFSMSLEEVSELSDASSHLSSIQDDDDPRHRGDGRDQASGSSLTASSSSQKERSTLNGTMSSTSSDRLFEAADVTAEQVAAAAASSLSLPQFCVGALRPAVQLLASCSATEYPGPCKLMHWLTLLMEHCIDPSVWSDQNSLAQDIAQSLELLIEETGKLVLQLNRTPYLEAPAAEVQRMKYTYLSIFFSKLLRTVTTPELVAATMSTTIKPLLMTLAADVCLAASCPVVKETIAEYLLVTDASQYQLFKRGISAGGAVECCCRLLMLMQQTDGQVSLKLQLANDALPSLYYHRYLPFVENCIKLCSDISQDTNASADSEIESKKLLLKLLSHYDMELQMHALHSTVNILQAALQVSAAVDPSSVACRRTCFLINRDVLYHVCSKIIPHQHVKVSRYGGQILLHLLKSQLLMTTSMWSQLMDHISTLMPVLQGYTDSNSDLGKCLLHLVELPSDGNFEKLSSLEVLRGNVRLLFSPDHRVRIDAASRLVTMLAREDNAAEKHPDLTHAHVACLPNLFVLEHARSLEPTFVSAIQAEGMRKVCSIFTSAEKTDASIRKVACDQLALILQDVTLHQASLEVDVLPHVRQHLTWALARDSDKEQSYIKFIPGCVKILRLLTHHSYSLRHSSAHESLVYFQLLRAALMYQDDAETCYDIAHLLILLLFDEVASIGATVEGESDSSLSLDRGFSLPSIVANLYKLPFKPTSHELVTTACTCSPAPDRDELLQDGWAKELRVQWNVSWHNGMEALVAYLRTDAASRLHVEDFPEHLKLSEAEEEAVMAGAILCGLRHSVTAVTNATSHAAVRQAVGRMCTYLLLRSAHADDAVYVLEQASWMEAFSRFLEVQPNSAADEELVRYLLVAVTTMLEIAPSLPESTRTWAWKVLAGSDSSLTSMLLPPGSSSSSSSTLATESPSSKELLALVRVYTSKVCIDELQRPPTGVLVQSLLGHLNIAGATHFYNLAALESTLSCLVYITARPGWSKGCADGEGLKLCIDLVHALIEVVMSFHRGRGGISMSFMGCAVTRAATVCLQHVAYEMAATFPETNWEQEWIYTSPPTTSSDKQTGLGSSWVVPLWAYRDPEVRAAGLAIVAALTQSVNGRKVMLASCPDIPGGLWGATLSYLLDHSEASIVREQAALVLVNLTSQPLAESADYTDPPWLGPIVKDEESGVSLVGLPALLALLHHTHFYNQLADMLADFYVPAEVTYHSLLAEAASATTPSENSLPIVTAAANFGRFPLHTNAVAMPTAQTPVTITTGTSTPASVPGTCIYIYIYNNVHGNPLITQFTEEVSYQYNQC